MSNPWPAAGQIWRNRHSDDEIMLVLIPRGNMLIGVRSPFQRKGEPPECWVDGRDMWQFDPIELERIFDPLLDDPNDEEWEYRGMFRDIVREIVNTHKAELHNFPVLPVFGRDDDGRLLRNIEMGK